MQIEEMKKENNAILQLLLQNQCFLEIIIEDVAEKLKEDFASYPDQLSNMMEIRRGIAERYYQSSIQEVKKIISHT